MTFLFDLSILQIFSSSYQRCSSETIGLATHNESWTSNMGSMPRAAKQILTRRKKTTYGWGKIFANDAVNKACILTLQTVLCSMSISNQFKRWTEDFHFSKKTGGQQTPEKMLIIAIY